MSVSRDGIPGCLELETSQLRANSSERDADLDRLQWVPGTEVVNAGLEDSCHRSPQKHVTVLALVSGVPGASFGGSRDVGCSRSLGVQIWCGQSNLCFLLLIHSDL